MVLPPTRFMHATASVNDTLIVFGGTGSELGQTQCLNDVWTFQSSTRQWVQHVELALNPQPLPRAGATL
ncbi:kelch repeat-containing protein, partial [Listeria monocytogenes]|uniref:kelch repeat-containing protein n=1 Tax=Listeria monocytogenes TaxID=1639 RepID=UPI002FDC32E4